MYYDVENVIAREKFISLETFLSGGFSREESGDAIDAAIYFRESNKNRQIKWLKHESGKIYAATR